jgi:hypothetical protein
MEAKRAEEEAYRSYAKQFNDFTADFEPSDQLMVVLEAHASQSFIVKVDHAPSKLKILMSVFDENPKPIITRVTKRGISQPIKDYKGKVELLEVVDLDDEMDVGTYMVEFTNTSYNMQDITFIIKDIPLHPETKEKLSPASKAAAIHANEASGQPAREMFDGNHEIDGQKISEQEFRMYQTLDKAYHQINHFQVEQGL